MECRPELRRRCLSCGASLLIPVPRRVKLSIRKALGVLLKRQPWSPHMKNSCNYQHGGKGTWLLSHEALPLSSEIWTEHHFPKSRNRTSLFFSTLKKKIRFYYFMCLRLHWIRVLGAQEVVSPHVGTGNRTHVFHNNKCP